MQRQAIYITLIVATLLGPLACCCTLGLACHSRQSVEPIASAPACPHCKPSPTQSPKPAVPEHPCPVCAKSVAPKIHVDLKPVLVMADEASFDALPISDTYAPVILGGMPWVVIDPSPRDFLLNQCHHLRC